MIDVGPQLVRLPAIVAGRADDDVVVAVPVHVPCRAHCAQIGAGLIALYVEHAEHLVHFEPRTLEHALDAAGLRLRELCSRGAGKFVRIDFVVERSERLHAWLPKLLAPLGRIGRKALYVNLFDEMIAVAEAR